MRAATTEEIEAEKSLIEKDAVSLYQMIYYQDYFVFGFYDSNQQIIVVSKRIVSLVLLAVFQKGRMEKTLETVRTNFNSIRTGRANPAMLDKIVV